MGGLDYAFTHFVIAQGKLPRQPILCHIAYLADPTFIRRTVVRKRRITMRIGSVIPEFTTLECVNQALIFTGVSLTTFAKGRGIAAISRRVCFTVIR